MMGLNPKDIEKAMRRMGIQQQEIDAVEVVIKTADKILTIKNPHVAKVNAMGQESYQITGNTEEKSIDTTPEINDDDIKTVMEQTGRDAKKAKEAIEKNNGDLAQAIIELKGN